MNKMDLDLIYQHPTSGGGIYQCGALEIPGIAKTLNTHGYIHCPVVVDGLKDLGFSIIALTSKGFQPQIETATAGSGLEVLHIPFADDEKLTSDEIAKVKKKVTSAADKMTKAVEQGQKVLSTCWAGINRSSLLTAYIIKNLDGSIDPQEIINTIRTQRSARCLNNKLFVLIILSR